MSDGLSLLDKSQLTSESYRLKATNRKPSRPWSVLPVSTGRSPAVIATVRTDSAAAGLGTAPSASTATVTTRSGLATKQSRLA